MACVPALPQHLFQGWICDNTRRKEDAACPFSHATAERRAADPRDHAGIPPAVIIRATAYGAVRTAYASREEERAMTSWSHRREGPGPSRCLVHPQGDPDRPLLTYRGNLHFHLHSLMGNQAHEQGVLADVAVVAAPHC